MSEFRVHLKPWSTTYSLRCGCVLERREDGGVAFVACRAHCEAFHVVTRWIEREGMSQEAAVSLIHGQKT